MNVLASRLLTPGTLTLIVLGLLALMAAPATAEVVFEGYFPSQELTWSSDSQGKFLPGLPGAVPLNQPGLPLLLGKDLLLLVPADMRVAEAWIEPITTHRLDQPGPLKTGAPLATSNGELISEARMAPAEGAFPATWGEYKGAHTWRGYQLLAVSVHPLRQGPGYLEFLDNYAVHVRYDGMADPQVMARRERAVVGELQANTSVLSSLVANPEMISGYGREAGVLVEKSSAGFVPDKSPSLSGSAVHYLIITNEEMAPEFQRLADHKIAQGINTVVTTREYIAANFRNGADIQETVRMFIRDAYQKWGTDYVLLGGDTDVLPARYVTNTFYPAIGSTDIPVDLYFACLDGNWNANGNAFYGEPATGGDTGDFVDFAEEVYIGRATVSNPAAAAVFVDKVITYELTPSNSQWPDRVIYAAEVLFPSEYEDGLNIVLDGAQFSHQMVNDLVEPCTDMHTTRMYETDVLFPRDAPLNRAALSDSLNTGHYGIFNQIGHGYFFNMSVGDGNFMTMDADNLVNGDHLFLLFSLNCASCAFDYSCLMERFLQNPNGGSVVSIGSARAAFPNTCNNYQQEFFSQLYCQGETRVGRLVALSRLPFIANTVFNYVDRWTFENYTLLGDPSLPIWTGSPRPLAMDVSPVGLGPNSVTVNVSSYSSAVEGALVCLSRDGEDQAFGVTDQNGMAQLDYLATAEGSIQLTVSGRNLRLSSVEVPVVDGVSYFTMQSVTVVDNGAYGSQGNGNLVAESGETLAIWPAIVETAGQGATGISGILTCDDPRIQVLNGQVYFPNIGAGGSALAVGPGLVTISEEIPDGEPVEFHLQVSDASGGNYVSTKQIVIKAPEVEVVSLDWEDATYGNGDGWLDNGERVTLTVKVKNFGAGRSDFIDATLRSDLPNVTVYDSLAVFSGLDLMDESAASTTFSLSLFDATRESISRLVLRDNYGRSQVHEFILQRPEPPLVIETDPSLGADVIALRWSPSSSTAVHGYDVFRSLAETGPFVKVNMDLISGVSYFRDEGLDLLTRYYYQVEAVGANLIASTPSVVVGQATAPAELSGFPVAFVDETSSHLAVGDVDGDGNLEIVMASDEVYVWHHDGTELLDGDGDSQTLGPFTNLNSTLQPAGIVLAQLDDQPGLEMIISDRGNAVQIYIFRKDGTVLPGWPQSLEGMPGTDWNWATPAAGDLDGDGDPEIVVNTVNGITWAWHTDGSEVLDGDSNPATNGVFLIREGASSEWSHSSPALYDLDHDGGKDIIFGCKTDNSGSKRLMALKADGSNVPGFPYIAQGAIDNSPAVGDLNNDGVMEIVFYDWSHNVYAVQEDGSDYPGFPVNFGVGSSLQPAPSVALGDMDDDGELEIVLAVNVAGDLSTMMVFDTDVAGGTSGSMLPGWPMDLPGSSESSPVLGDIDGDSSPDIVFGIGGFNEDSPNNMYAFHADGQPIDGFPITLTGPIWPSPVITDLDHDFDVDIVYGGWDRIVHVWDMPFAYDRRNVPWPTFHGNMQRDGVFFPIALVGVEEPEEQLPSALKVGIPYPNPFNPSTSVRLYVPDSGGGAELELAVYDVLGRRVRVLHQGAISSGWHTLVWDGRDDKGHGQASGMYFMRARSSGLDAIRKMTLLK